MSTAFVVFAKATLQDRQIPFVIGDRRELRRTRQDRLGKRGMKVWEDFKSRKEDLGLPDMTMDEIDAEIAAARKERREREAQETSAKAMAV